MLKKRIQTGAQSLHRLATNTEFLAPPCNTVHAAKSCWICFNITSQNFLKNVYILQVIFVTTWSEHEKKKEIRPNKIKLGLRNICRINIIISDNWAAKIISDNPTMQSVIGLLSLDADAYTIYPMNTLTWKHTHVFRLKDMAYHLVLLLWLRCSRCSFNTVLWGCARHAASCHQDHNAPNICNIGYSTERVVHHRLLWANKTCKCNLWMFCF